jgi:hypothetical protein
VRCLSSVRAWAEIAPLGQTAHPTSPRYPISLRRTPLLPNRSRGYRASLRSGASSQRARRLTGVEGARCWAGGVGHWFCRTPWYHNGQGAVLSLSSSNHLCKRIAPCKPAVPLRALPLLGDRSPAASGRRQTTPRWNTVASVVRPSARRVDSHTPHVPRTTLC